MRQLFDKAERPFLAINDRYICRFSKYKNWKVRTREIINDFTSAHKISSTPYILDLISEDKLNKNELLSKTYIIDIRCRKFPVKGISTNGFERDLFNLFGLVGKRRYYFEFVVGEPEQLSFEQARAEIVDHICNHRWVGQAGGTPSHFRKLQASRKDMAELIAGISFFGKWPF